MVKEVVYRCDYCGCSIGTMNVGHVLGPLPNSEDLGNWQAEVKHFCGYMCLLEFLVKNWPRKETIHYAGAVAGFAAFRQGVKTGVVDRAKAIDAIDHLLGIVKLHRLRGEIQKET